MYLVSSKIQRVIAMSLRTLMLCAAATALVSASGCKRGPKGRTTDDVQPPITSNPPAQTNTAAPESVRAEGPRPGDTLPFPELKQILFDYQRAEIRADQLPVLEGNLAYLKANGDKVLIVGHCDERGTNEYNLALGERRAVAIRDYYINGGIPGARVATLSRGEEEPAAIGHDEEAWGKNRRAEFLRMF